MEILAINTLLQETKPLATEEETRQLKRRLTRHIFLLRYLANWIWLIVLAMHAIPLDQHSSQSAGLSAYNYYTATMMVKLSLFLLLSLVLVLIEGYNEKILYNIDMPGGDLHGMPIHMDPGASPSECQQLCGNRHACKIWAYTLNKCRKPLCWLKYKPRRQNRNRCTVSIIVSADMHYS